MHRTLVRDWSSDRCGRSHWGRGVVVSKIGIVVIIVLVLNVDTSDLGNYRIFPSGNRHLIVCGIHPHSHGSLFAISSRKQRTLETEMIGSRQGKGKLYLTQRGGSTRLSWLGSQEHIRLRLFISILWDEIAVSERKETVNTE